MSFHTLGDSHATSGWCKIPGVTTHSYGPWTAYGFARDGVDKFDIRTIVNPGDSLCFCMGEIDCRCHIHKHCEGTRPEWTIGKVVSDYLAAIAEHQRRVEGLKVYIYSVPPTVRASSNHGCRDDFPLVGSDEERKTYVRLWNEMLFYHGKPYGFIPVDVEAKYRDADWFLDAKYSDGTVHIDDPVFIKEALDSVGWVS